MCLWCLWCSEMTQTYNIAACASSRHPRLVKQIVSRSVTSAVCAAEWVRQQASGSSPGSSEGAAAAEAAIAAGAAPLPGYGGSMRLLTDLPPARPVQDTLLMQVWPCRLF